MHTPLSKFKRDQQSSDFVVDPCQEQAVQQLQQLFDSLISLQQMPSLLSRLLNPKPSRPAHKGLYIWGDVGRGKTYLMDLFYACLPFEEKTRTHFHPFMASIHQQLEQFKGHKNPLTKIANDLASKTRVICFDEFFVNDITDAMILAQLFSALLEHHVVLVVTSNIAPDQLYENGLQRERFLPAIKLIKHHTHSVNLGDGVDYRLRHLTQASVYYYPLDDNSHKAMRMAFNRLTNKHSHSNHFDSSYEPSTCGYASRKDNANKLIINHRTFEYIEKSGEVIWFAYDQLCKLPRSANDYLHLAKQYRTLFISGVPNLTSAEDDQARRFINLIDIGYDHHIKLLISSAAPISQLYSGIRLAFAFKRTQSRLYEMQTEGYLAKVHQATY